MENINKPFILVHESDYNGTYIYIYIYMQQHTDLSYIHLC